jgi:hypothetical protein
MRKSKNLKKQALVCVLWLLSLATLSGSIWASEKNSVLKLADESLVLALSKNKTFSLTPDDLENCALSSSVSKEFLQKFSGFKQVETLEDLNEYQQTIHNKIQAWTEKKWKSKQKIKKGLKKCTAAIQERINGLKEKLKKRKQGSGQKIFKESRQEIIQRKAPESIENKLDLRKSTIIEKEDAPPFIKAYTSRFGESAKIVDFENLYHLSELHQTTTGQNIHVGFYEEDANLNHPLFKKCAEQGEYVCSVVKGDQTHGTATGSIIARMSPGIKLSLIRKHDKSDRFKWLKELASKEKSIDILNLSMSWSKKANEEAEEILEPFLEKGTLIIKSAGNDPERISKYLTNFVKEKGQGRLLIVGSLKYDDKGNEFHNERTVHATGVDVPFICAPGTDILLAHPEDNRHRVGSGTSYAAPIVAGALALLMQRFPMWKETPEKYIDLLLKSTRKKYLRNGGNLEETPLAIECGQGILDIEAALKQGEIEVGY